MTAPRGAGAVLSAESQKVIAEALTKFQGTALEASPEEEIEQDEDDLDLPDFTDEEWDSLDFEVPWHGVIAPTGRMSGDRRTFDDGSITNRNLPVPIKYMPSDKPGHDDSVVVGNITEIFQQDGLIKASGNFWVDKTEGSDAIISVANQYSRGISVDLDMAVAEFRNEDGTPFIAEDYKDGDPEPVQAIIEGRVASATLCAIPAFQEAFINLGTWADEDAKDAVVASGCWSCEASAQIEAISPEHAAELTPQFAEQDLVIFGQEYPVSDGTKYRFTADAVEVFAPGTHDGPGWVTNPKETQRLRTYWTKGEGAAKIRWGMPGDFNRCRKQLAKYVTNPNYLAGTCANLHKVALGLWPGMEEGGKKKHSIEGEATAAFSLVASGAQGLPGAWFNDPALEGPTPLQVTPEGRVFGHLAAWGTCHLNPMYEVCLTPPESPSQYAYFTTGAVDTDDGQRAVGQITMDTGHAPMNASAFGAVQHYDNTGWVVADVAAGEDAHGIWLAGALRPGVSDEQRRAISAAALSGDWRDVRNELELVGVLAVNVPGFPIPRVTVTASAGHQTALVASGIVTTSSTEQPTTTLSVEAVVAAAIDMYEARNIRRERLSRLRTQLRKDALVDLRRNLED